MSYSRGKPEGIRKWLSIDPNVVTPECFYRGSSPNTPGFLLKACGNDGSGIQAIETEHWQRKK
jgi:hypothetical protein